MNGKLWRFAAALLPICFLSAQQPDSQSPQPTGHVQLHGPSPEVMRKIAEERQRMAAHAVAINDLAGHVQSLDDARKLVNLVYAEFAKELPPKWATRSIRERIARAEYESASEPGSLITEQHVADAWNDYLQKIGGPQESYVTAAEIHTLRDSYYTSSQFFWGGLDDKQIWTIPNIYAIGRDGKVANGCRALEALNILWKLGNQPELLKGTRELIKKGELFSNEFKEPSKPRDPGTVRGYVSFSVMPPNPVEQAAYRYIRAHGEREFNRAVERLLKDLLAG